jgi:uncharacterized membrane protein YdjX (TVP38/TMEM64 family)
MLEYFNEVLWQIHEILNANPYLIALLLIIMSNLFIPASIIVIFLVSAYGLNTGIFLSLLVYIISSLIPYFIYNYTSLKIDNFLNEKHLFLYKSAMKKNILIYLIIIRIMSLPFVIQNILCSVLTDNFKKYLFTSVIGSIFWVVLLAYFYSQIISLKIEFMLISLVVFFGSIWLLNYKVNKYINK